MRMYQVVESKGRKRETYMMGFSTNAEMTSWLNGKRSMEDENKYSIVAWDVTNRNEAYINLNKYWN